MAATVQETIKKLATDPHLLQSLQKAGTDDARKKILHSAGLGAFSKAEVEKEIKHMLGSAQHGPTAGAAQPGGPDMGTEPVNHVAAVAAAAAAAAAPPA